MVGCAEGGGGAGTLDVGTGDSGTGDSGTGDSGADTSGDTGPCTVDSDCTDDGVMCNGPTVCVAGACVAGMAPTCDDGVMCTQDSCSLMMDECQHVPNDDLCLDGTICSAVEDCVVPTTCVMDSDCVGDGGFCAGSDACVEGSVAARA